MATADHYYEVSLTTPAGNRVRFYGHDLLVSPWLGAPQPEEQGPEEQELQEAQPELLLTVPAAAHALGMSERWMWSRVHARDLPIVCLGRRRMIRPADLEAFIDSRVDRAKAEVL